MDWDQGTEQTATPVCSDNWNWNSLAHQLIRIQGQYTPELTGGFQALHQGHTVPGESTRGRHCTITTQEEFISPSQDDDGFPVSFNANEIWKTQSSNSLRKTSHSEQGHVTMYVTQPITQTSPSNSPDSFVNIEQMFLLKSLNYSKIYIF